MTARDYPATCDARGREQVVHVGVEISASAFRPVALRSGLALVAGERTAIARRHEGDRSVLAASDGDRQSCIGKISEACGVGARATPDVIECNAREREIWEAMIEADLARLSKAPSARNPRNPRTAPRSRLAQVLLRDVKSWRTWTGAGVLSAFSNAI